MIDKSPSGQSQSSPRSASVRIHEVDGLFDFSFKYSVFISYRREYDSGYAGRIYDRIVSALPRLRVFFDTNSILSGENFVWATSEVRRAGVLLVVIGPGWIKGIKRLSSPDDFVRSEIESALILNRPVLPVLLDAIEMPSQAHLPATLHSLASLNAHRVRHDHFDKDIEDLLKQISVLSNQASRKRFKKKVREIFSRTTSIASRTERLNKRSELVKTEASFRMMRSLRSTSPALAVDGLHFSRPSTGSSFALENICLEVPLGGSLSISGLSGSGKSTFIRAICGMEKISSGVVKIGERRLNDMSFHDIAARVGFVSDSPKFFSGSVFENVSHFDREASEKEVLELTRVVGLEDALMFDGKLQLDMRRLAFSSGQRQRLAIARALYGKPTIVLADEPLTFLSYERHPEILENVLTYTKKHGIAFICTSSYRSSYDYFDRRFELTLQHEGRATGATLNQL